MSASCANKWVAMTAPQRRTRHGVAYANGLVMGYVAERVVSWRAPGQAASTLGKNKTDLTPHNVSCKRWDTPKKCAQRVATYALLPPSPPLALRDQAAHALRTQRRLTHTRAKRPQSILHSIGKRCWRGN